MELRNREGETIAASALVSMDFSYLVRLGLRSASDTRILNTIKVVDQVLSVNTPSGTLYHRYNEDGYGERADGGPFADHGIGRAWPLLVGERGHLALQAGEDPLPYLKTMHACASTGGLLPEQVWDADAIVDRELFPGRPSGSAMPLLWSHAEFLKLLIAGANGRPLELLEAIQRHFAEPQKCRVIARHWRDSAPFFSLERDVSLLIESSEPFTLHWGVNAWQQIQEHDATVGPLGVWAVQFSAEALSAYSRLDFTRRFARGWEGFDHTLALNDRPLGSHR